MYYSVIVPTYNEDKFIERCLCSVLHQNVDRSEYEIIVSDASSSDNTLLIAQKYSDVIVITNERGISIGRNQGANKASGEILVFVDADAELAPDFLSHCQKIFSNPSVAGMSGIAHPDDGNFIQKLVYKGTYFLVIVFGFFGISLFPGICIAYRRKCFIDAGGFNQDFGVVEDLDLSRRISRFGKCIVNRKANAFVSTRRLKKNLISTVFFHIYCDVKYLITGKAPAVYLKSEEIGAWQDIWKQLKPDSKMHKEIK